MFATNDSDHPVRIVAVGFERADGSDEKVLSPDSWSFQVGNLYATIPPRDSAGGTIMYADFEGLFEPGEGLRAFVVTSTDKRFRSKAVMFA